MLVDSFLRTAAERLPAKVALVCDQRRLTYRELDESCDAVAAGLRALGVERGDRVVIHLENNVEAVLSVFGALRADAVFVPVNPTVKEDKLAYILSDSGATVVISDRRCEDVVAKAVRAAPGVKAVVLVGAAAAAAEADPAFTPTPFDALVGAPGGAPRPQLRNIDLDLAALIYTSGSTGRPRGVALTHASMVTAATSIHNYLALAPDEVVLNVLPLSFDYGLYQVFLTWMAGGCLVLERAFVYPSTLLALIARERVTGLPMVPMIAALFLRQDLSAYDLSSLRYITNTGAVLPTAHVTALRAQLPQVKIFKMYGLTECKRVSYLAPDEIDSHPESVGKPMDNVEVYLVDGEGRRQETGVGELVIRGSNIMQGYWGAPDETARVLKTGPLPGERVLHTGDLFRIDEGGYMYFISRTDDVIKCRGQKVGPREVENALHAVPGVLEASVIGVPDPVVGEAIKAYVTLDGSQPVTEQDVLRYCARHLEDFMVPKSVEIVAALPRTGSGKVARRHLDAPPAH